MYTSFPAPESTAVGEDERLTRAHLGSLLDVTVSSVTFVGGGNMGSALVGGLIKSGWAPAKITIAETSADRRTELRRLFPEITVIETPDSCESAVIAVKPTAAIDAYAAVVAAGARRIVSIVAGVNISTLQKASGDSVAVIRAMPNTPALVGKGACAISFSPNCLETDIVWAEEILGSVGTVVRVSESQMDAVTAISGSGPAYVFLLAECLISEAVRHGLSPSVADGLVRQLLVGSSALLSASPETPAVLRDRVTSPNGTTWAAIEAMEQAGFRQAITAAISAAVRRSRELGG